jgi:hypothetical protein
MFAGGAGSFILAPYSTNEKANAFALAFFYALSRPE